MSWSTLNRKDKSFGLSFSLHVVYACIFVEEPQGRYKQFYKLYGRLLLTFVFQILIIAETRKIFERKIFAGILTTPNNSEDKFILIMNTR